MAQKTTTNFFQAERPKTSYLVSNKSSSTSTGNSSYPAERTAIWFTNLPRYYIITGGLNWKDQLLLTPGFDPPPVETIAFKMNVKRPLY